MPLPPALLARLKQRGIIKEKNGILQKILFNNFSHMNFQYHILNKLYK